MAHHFSLVGYNIKLWFCGMKSTKLEPNIENHFETGLFKEIWFNLEYSIGIPVADISITIPATAQTFRIHEGEAAQAQVG